MSIKQTYTYHCVSFHQKGSHIKTLQRDKTLRVYL